jgi:hypothetical protein
MSKPAYHLIIDAACPNKTILQVALGISQLHSLVGGGYRFIPTGKEIHESGAKGLPCRDGLFDVVNANVVGFPNDADPCEFINSLLEDPVLTARYKHLLESAFKSAREKMDVNLYAANERRSHGKVALTIGHKTRVFETLQELHRLNSDPNKVIHLPKNQHPTKRTVAVQIFNAQLANPTFGLVREASRDYHSADRFIEFPAFSLKFLDMDRAAAACEYNATEKKSSRKSSKATKKAPTYSILDHFKPAAPKRNASKMTESDSDSDSDWIAPSV